MCGLQCTRAFLKNTPLVNMLVQSALDNLRWENRIAERSKQAAAKERGKSKQT